MAGKRGFLRDMEMAISSCKEWCRRRGSNPHARKGRRILSPVRLPVPPLRLCQEALILMRTLIVAQPLPQSQLADH
jgi:hypothetical protein